MKALALTLALSVAVGTATMAEGAKKLAPGEKEKINATPAPAKKKASGVTNSARANVRSSLPASVQGLPVGPLRGGLGVLPANVRNQFGGNFLLDLGRGRILRSRGWRGDFVLGLSSPRYAGGKLPISGDCSAFVPVDGIAPGAQPLDPIDGGGGSVVPADGGPAIQGPGVEQVQFLRVNNQTARNVRVSVAASRGRASLVYDFRPGESNFLAVAPNRRLAASKVRIWAAGGGRSWTANQSRPLDLNLAAGRGVGLRAVTYAIR